MKAFLYAGVAQIFLLTGVLFTLDEWQKDSWLSVLGMLLCSFASGASLVVYSQHRAAMNEKLIRQWLNRPQA